MALRGFIGVGSGRIQNGVMLSRSGGARFFEVPCSKSGIALWLQPPSAHAAFKLECSKSGIALWLQLAALAANFLM